MNLVSIEAPAARMASARKPFELFNTPLGIVSAGHRLQVVANQLIEAFAQSFGLLASASDELLVDGEGEIHVHIIRGHVLCVNDW